MLIARQRPRHNQLVSSVDGGSSSCKNGAPTRACLHACMCVRVHVSARVHACVCVCVCM